MRVRVPPFTRIEPAHGLKPGSSTRTSWVPADTSGIESGARPTASPSRNTCAPRFDSTSITPASFVVAAVAGCAAARLGTRVRVVDGGGAGTASALELVCGAGAGTLASRGSSVSGAVRGGAGGLPGAAITSVGAGAGAEAMTRYANPYPAANPPISPARTATVPTSRTRTFSAGGCSTIEAIDGASYVTGIRRKAGSRSAAGATGVSDANPRNGSGGESNSCEPMNQGPFCTRTLQVVKNYIHAWRPVCAQHSATTSNSEMPIRVTSSSRRPEGNNEAERPGTYPP